MLNIRRKVARKERAELYKGLRSSASFSPSNAYFIQRRWYTETELVKQLRVEGTSKRGGRLTLT
jgi:hypothetical protein